MTRTIEEEFDFVCKSAGLVKLGISKKPTWLTADKSEGVELDGTTVRMFNNNNGERDYKDAPGSKLQAIVDAFKMPAPKPEPDTERAKIAKNEPEPKAQPKPAEVVAPEKVEHKPDAVVPANTFTPQGNIIKGIIPSLKEIGKIKIGKKGEERQGQKGNYRLPTKFDHFEITTIIRDEKTGDFPLDPIMQQFKEMPKELSIMLLYNDPTLNFSTRYNAYKGGKCLCSGNGVTAKNLLGESLPCNPDTCEVFQKKGCKPNGILQVILTDAPRLGGVYKFRTTSYNSIRSILSSLFFLSSLTGGVLAMIPLKLTVSPMQVQPKDSDKAQTIYVVNVEFAGTAQKLLETVVEVAKYQGSMRAQIQQLEATARLALDAPESEEEIKAVIAEFYPEKQEAKA